MQRGSVSSHQLAQVAKQPPQSCIQSSYSPQQTVLTTATLESHGELKVRISATEKIDRVHLVLIRMVIANRFVSPCYSTCSYSTLLQLLLLSTSSSEPKNIKVGYTI